jgi:thioredoxin-related protein
LFFLSCSKSNEQANPGPTSQPTPRAQQAIQAASVQENPAVDENGWYYDWDTGLAAAREQQRPVIIDFYTDWCHWCQVMDEETFADPLIKQKFAEGWIMIKTDAEDTQTRGTFKGETLTYRELAAKFRIQGYPSYAFIDKNGDFININENPIVGYREVPGFAVILDYFKEEIYTLDEAGQKRFFESR